MTIYAYSIEQRRSAKETQRRYKMTTHRTLKKKKMTTQIVLLCDIRDTQIVRQNTLHKYSWNNRKEQNFNYIDLYTNNVVLQNIQYNYVHVTNKDTLKRTGSGIGDSFIL